MSADRQRLKNAIRAIALTPEERRQLLGEGQNKGGKASSAGVGVSDAERDRICCDGSTSGSANPGTEEREVGDSQSGLDPSDPADIGGGDGTLSGVTDCATGQPVCFDGAGFIPPDGWDDPGEPGPVEGYQEGYFWETVPGFGGDCEKDLPIDAAQCTANQYNDGSIHEFYQESETLYYLEVLYFTSGGSGRFVEHSVVRRECGSSSFNCTKEPPTADSWPEDGCVNLAVKDGSIVGSKYDPENDGSYSAPRDSIDLCDSEGNQISLAPAANGGWKTINSTTNNGYLYDSSGTQIAHIDGNEYSDPTI